MGDEKKERRGRKVVYYYSTVVDILFFSSLALSLPASVSTSRIGHILRLQICNAEEEEWEEVKGRRQEGAARKTRK